MMTVQKSLIKTLKANHNGYNNMKTALLTVQKSLIKTLKANHNSGH